MSATRGSPSRSGEGSECRARPRAAAASLQPGRQDAVRHRHRDRAAAAGLDPVHLDLERRCRPVAHGVHQHHQTAGIERRIAQRHRRHLDPDRDRHRDRHPDRADGRHLPRRIWRAFGTGQRGALRLRRAAVGAVDPDRPVHLRARGGAVRRVFRHRRLPRAGRARDSDRRAHHRGHAAADLPVAARGGGGARRAEMESHRADLLSRGEGRHHDRHPAGDRPHRRRDRAAAVHQPGQSELVDQSGITRWPACR